MTQSPRRVVILLGVVVLSAVGGFVVARSMKGGRTDSLADGFLALGTPPLAMEAFRVLHDESPDDPLARAGLAIAYFRRGQQFHDQRKFVEALSHFRKAIDLQAEVYYFHLELGKALSDNEQTAEALAAYEEAVRLNPESIGANIMCFGLLLDANRFEEAEQCLQRLIKKAPEQPPLREAVTHYYEMLCEVLESAGDEAGAAAARQRAGDLASR